MKKNILPGAVVLVILLLVMGGILFLHGRMAAAEAPVITPVRPSLVKDKPPVGLFTGAVEKAAAPAPEKPADPEEDPFDSIFKIFNTK